MATDIDQTYNGWTHDKLSDHDDSQEVSISQMLDHGSVSFGRFAVESLSWERRSVFSCNRRQEELEKFRTPGLVAQKKAYFEEYYKKIQAMKTMQENQHTELPLDHGGDIFSQTGEDSEEDETTAQLESLRNGAANASNSCLKEAADGAALEKEKSFNKSLQINLNQEIVSPLEKSLEEIEEENISGCDHRMQPLDMESLVHESFVKSKEKIDQHDLSGLDDGGIVVTTQRTALFSQGSKPENSECALIDNTTVAKIKSTTKKHMEKHVSVLKVKKEPAASVRNGPKSDCKNKSEIKSTQGPKYPSQRTISKADNIIFPSKTNADRVSSNYRSTSVVSYRPLTEVRPNVTIPCPFSFATAKRPAVPSGIREGMQKLDPKTSNKSAPSLAYAKDVADVQVIQVTSKKSATTSNVKRRGLENKRGFGEVKRIPLTSDCKNTILRGGATMLGPPKASYLKSRSINLPAQDKSDTNGGTVSRSIDTVRRNRKKEEKFVARCMPEVHGFCSKSVARPPTGNLNTESKKISPTQTGNLSANGRKTPFGDLSLDGRRPRQMMPRWR